MSSLLPITEELIEKAKKLVEESLKEKEQFLKENLGDSLSHKGISEEGVQHLAESLYGNKTNYDWVLKSLRYLPTPPSKIEAQFPDEEYFIEFIDKRPDDLEEESLDNASQEEKVAFIKGLFEPYIEEFAEPDEEDPFPGIFNFGNNQLYSRDYEHMESIIAPKNIAEKYFPYGEYKEVEDEELERNLSYFKDSEEWSVYYLNLLELNKSPDTRIMKYEFPGLVLIDHFSDQDPDRKVLSFKDLIEFNEVDPEFAVYWDNENDCYKPALLKQKS
ncbi:hypothetical protein [Prochlorococcus sp. MIT 1223]|uniref:hypothetical protein n=1 Tax=Prochlorococcus sp. MIT 1223 TaxID=3096217 RepID=UPI002A75A6C3|nr:hypothetical protein [Prochlorococcus sp. MIT 1223]